MIHICSRCVLRPPEPMDTELLYKYKNDVETAGLLGGFHVGLSRADITEWIERHRKNKTDVLWVIADQSDDSCLGHVGLYQVDHRIRCAEFAIMIGARDRWGKGLGREVTTYVVQWGFTNLNLNRVSLSVLATNDRAIRLYRSLGFVEEGRCRQAQFKDGAYLDVIMMAILKSEHEHEG